MVLDVELKIKTLSMSFREPQIMINYFIFLT